MDAMRVGLHYEPKGNTKMKHFKATIKEKGMDGVIRTLLPEFVGDATKEYLINFWGLNNPDVLEWKIEELDD